eukprot:767306-Hanusia_phi.AAC.2
MGWGSNPTALDMARRIDLVLVLVMLKAATLHACRPGMFSLPDLSCQFCPAGKYKWQESNEVPDPYICLDCLAGEWSKPGSFACSCDVGYEGTAGGPSYSQCTACTDGYYKDWLGNDQCKPCTPHQNITCVIGFYPHSCNASTDIFCSPCSNRIPQNSVYQSPGTFDSNDCAFACKAGFQYNMDGANCTFCPAGKYRISMEMASCEDCAAGKYSSEGQTTCQECTACPAGKSSENGCTGGASQDNVCSTCPPNTYSEDGHTESCNACDANARSPENSSSPFDCRCIAGYVRVDRYVAVAGTMRFQRDCTPCPSNTWANDTFSVCFSCPDHSSSPPGSKHPDQCTCEQGYIRQGQECVLTVP